MFSEAAILAWSKFQELLRRVGTAFGAPDDLRRVGMLRLDMHLEIRAHLRSLEHFARRMLLLCTFDIKLAPPKPTRAKPPSKKPPSKRGIGFKLLDEPRRSTRSRERKWDGCYNIEEREALRAAKRNRWLPTAPLAARLEALARVGANPERYAKRLARRLTAAPALGPRILNAMPPSKDHFTPHVRAE